MPTLPAKPEPPPAFQLFEPAAGVQIHRGSNLPHWFQPGATHFLTFRTADSIPAAVAAQWKSRQASWLRGHDIDPSSPEWKRAFQKLAPEIRGDFHAKFSAAFLEALDAGHGSCPLRSPRAASAVVEAMRCFDGTRYRLGDFVVMPNHAHVLLATLGEETIESIGTSWKRFSARAINRQLGCSGRFWQAESFDHLVRHAKQLHRIRGYIEDNPKHLPAGSFRLWRSPAATPPLPRR